MDNNKGKRAIRVIRRVSPADFARITGHSARTVTQMCVEGRMPGAVRNVSGHWEIDVDAARGAVFLKRGRPVDKGAVK